MMHAVASALRRAVMAVCVFPVLSACATGTPAPTASMQAAASMVLDAALSHDRDAAGTAVDVVAVQVRVADAAGHAMLAPRLLVKVGEPASIRVGTDTAWTDIQVTTRREGSAVLVDAALSESGGPVRIRASAQATDAPPAAGAK